MEDIFFYNNTNLTKFLKLLIFCFQAQYIEFFNNNSNISYYKYYLNYKFIKTIFS